MEVSRPPPTSREDLDKALEAVTAHKGEWVDLPIGERLDLVRRVRKDFRSVQQRWSDLSVAAKGIDERTLGNDREWMEIACINRTHFVTERALKDIQRYGKPKVYGGYSTRPNGQVVAHTYPDCRAHRYLFQGTTEEVWLEPGVTMEEAKARQAIAYNGGVKEGRLALVLGAGNASP
ncbi:MAG: hypothetical protein KAQ96_11695, partial [Thermoplasmata archaeon]|nr:hypothetical protein [Thermoplasmata archaeon]